MRDEVVCVVGLGYVGAPLLYAASTHYSCYGFDLDESRLAELISREDRNGEIDFASGSLAAPALITSDLASCSESSLFVVTVPTPIDRYKVPNLDPLKSACRAIGSVMQLGSIIVFESTVFPGTTEEICIPILEEVSGLRFGVDFDVGYSPERINPGDKQHGVSNIAKIISAATKEGVSRLEAFYGTFVDAVLHIAPSIKVAEAAKVLENIQRDVNIALMNEVSMIFSAMKIDTNDVIDAASSKWNFIPFRPGLVGGHCIGVDPYYLVYKAMATSQGAKLIAGARSVNETYVSFIGEAIINGMVTRKLDFSVASVLILGCAFKENCPDTRNSKVLDLYEYLRELDIDIDIYDPVADLRGSEMNGLYPKDDLDHLRESYDAVVLAVPHDSILKEDRVRELINDARVVFDLKGELVRADNVWRP